MQSKYIKPHSVAWWASVAPLLAGIVLALSAAFPALLPLAAIIDAASGGMSAPVLINAGVMGIGLRGAMT